MEAIDVVQSIIQLMEERAAQLEQQRQAVYIELQNAKAQVEQGERVLSQLNGGILELQKIITDARLKAGEPVLIPPGTQIAPTVETAEVKGLSGEKDTEPYDATKQPTQPATGKAARRREARKGNANQ